VRLSKRIMRETDLLAFEIAVLERPARMVMCSYNKVNGDWACENDYLLNQLLKKTWGFKGVVVSDWNATHSTAKAAMAGLDCEQPRGPPDANRLLPLDAARVKSIAIIGSKVDTSVLWEAARRRSSSGGGPSRFSGPAVWFPSSP